MSLLISSNILLFKQFENANNANLGSFEKPPLYLSLKGLKPATSCVRDQYCHHSTSKTHVRDRNVKLSQIYAPVIFQILYEFAENTE